MSGTTNQANLAEERVIDVREISSRVRHVVVVQLVGTLRQGEGLEILHDHDPKRLRFDLEAEYGGRFEWTYLETGPDLWRIRISRLPSLSDRTAGGNDVSAQE